MLGSRPCSCCYWRKSQPSEARERLPSQRPWLDAPPRRHHIPFSGAPPSSPPVPGRLAQAKRSVAGPGSMADPPAGSSPVTRQISSTSPGQHMEEEPVELRDAAKCVVVDAAGKAIPFGSLYREQKAIVVFVRHFLCYACKEYVEDLGKVSKKCLQDANVRLVVIGQSSHHHIKHFCNLTGYPHDMYVDPEREIYRIFHMKSGEEFSITAKSPHVKSNWLSGNIKSMWRAMASPAFDFQGDPAQQGGTFILGPGNEIHFAHLDRNRLDHVPINTVLQLAGVQAANFTNRSQIIDV
ncbi:hypothetical protein lerEdw1_000196 [Lerista edwardsae]|nr:hypothetical protein lerEdw1_000196 [Lerista edwardsae]